MALRNLSTATMIALSGAWLDPKGEPLKLLSAHELAIGLIPRLAKAHRQLLTNPKQGPAIALSEALADIREEQCAADTRHDRKARGVFMVLSGFAELAEIEGEEASLLRLRDLLFPDGTSIVNRSYIEEAGEAKLVLRRMTEDVHKALERLPSLRKRTLADEVDAWLVAGERLGKLEAKRALVESAIAAAPAAITPASVSRTRGAWMRVVKVLVESLSLDDEPNASITELIFKPLWDAEARADNRAATRRGEANASRLDEMEDAEPDAKDEIEAEI